MMVADLNNDDDDDDAGYRFVRGCWFGTSISIALWIMIFIIIMKLYYWMG